MLIRHTLRYLPAQLLSPLAQLGSMVLWTHWLSPAGMGVFTLVTAAQELAYLVSVGWFSSYALRFLPAREDASGRLRYLVTENAVMLASVALGCACALLAWGLLPADERELPLLAAIAASFVTRSASQHYAERARAQSAFVAYGVLQLAGPVGGLLLGWAAMRWLGATPQVLLGAYALAQATGLALAAPALGLLPRIGRPDTVMLRAAFAFGAPVLSLTALAWVGENQIRYSVQWARDAEALGLMILGWSLGRRCASVTAMLVTTAAFPLAARLYNEGRRAEALAQLGVSATLLVAVLLPATTLVALVGGPLLEPLVGGAYREATGDLLALAMIGGAVRNLLVHVIHQLMVLEMRWRMLVWVDVAEIVLGVAATLAGVALAEQRGAVVGQGLAGLAVLAAGIVLCRRHFGFVWPWAGTGRVLLACGAMAAVLLALQSRLHGPIELLAGAALAGAVGVAVLALLFRPQLRGAWRQRRQRS